MDARRRPSSAAPTASGGISRLALARAAATGIDTAPLICRAGLSAKEMDDPNRTVIDWISKLRQEFPTKTLIAVIPWSALIIVVAR